MLLLLRLLRLSLLLLLLLRRALSRQRAAAQLRGDVAHIQRACKGTGGGRQARRAGGQTGRQAALYAADTGFCERAPPTACRKQGWRPTNSPGPPHRRSSTHKPTARCMQARTGRPAHAPAPGNSTRRGKRPAAAAASAAASGACSGSSGR